MYHLLPDIRVTRRLTAHQVIAPDGTIIGHWKTFGEALHHVAQLPAGKIAIHVGDRAIVIEIVNTCPAEEADGLDVTTARMLPWLDPSHPEGA